MAPKPDTPAETVRQYVLAAQKAGVSLIRLEGEQVRVADRVDPRARRLICYVERSSPVTPDIGRPLLPGELPKWVVIAHPASPYSMIREALKNSFTLYAPASLYVDPNLKDPYPPAPEPKPVATTMPSGDVVQLPVQLHHVVYVVDRSGSMADVDDLIESHMKESVPRLRPVQDFHVIMIAGNGTHELEHRRLVPAEDRYKESAANYLAEGPKGGPGDPVAALKRAYEVMASADPRKPGKLIYFLSDGRFSDEQAALLLQTARQEGSLQRVYINTYHYGQRISEAEAVLLQLARENGGRFKHVDE